MFLNGKWSIENTVPVGFLIFRRKKVGRWVIVEIELGTGRGILAGRDCVGGRSHCSDWSNHSEWDRGSGWGDNRGSPCRWKPARARSATASSADRGLMLNKKFGPRLILSPNRLMLYSITYRGGWL